MNNFNKFSKTALLILFLSIFNLNYIFTGGKSLIDQVGDSINDLIGNSFKEKENSNLPVKKADNLEKIKDDKKESENDLNIPAKMTITMVSTKGVINDIINSIMKKIENISNNIDEEGFFYNIQRLRDLWTCKDCPGFTNVI